MRRAEKLDNQSINLIRSGDRIAGRPLASLARFNCIVLGMVGGAYGGCEGHLGGFPRR